MLISIGPEVRFPVPRVCPCCPKVSIHTHCKDYSRPTSSMNVVHIRESPCQSLVLVFNKWLPTKPDGQWSVWCVPTFGLNVASCFWLINWFYPLHLHNTSLGAVMDQYFVLDFSWNCQYSTVSVWESATLVYCTCTNCWLSATTKWECNCFGYWSWITGRNLWISGLLLSSLQCF